MGNKMTGSKHKAIFFGLVLGMLILCGIIVSRMASPADEGNSKPDVTRRKLPAGTFEIPKEQLVRLQVEPVRALNFQPQKSTDGNIATNDNTAVNLFSPYSGRVTQLFAKVGDVVKKGQPLMSVEASEFVQGQNDLIAAHATLDTANKQLVLAEKTENRQHELYLAKAGALKDWLQSQVDLTAAQSSVRTAETALSAARNRLRILGKSNRDIDSLENQPTATRMQAEAVVPAPISGTVVQRQVGLGQYLQSASTGASTPVFSIADLSTVWLVANLREEDAGSVHVGAPVEVKVLAYPDRTFRAKITFVSPSVDPVTHRIPVRAEIENRDSALKPMMLGSFRILTGEPQHAPAVPQSAVVYEGSKAHVFIVRDNGLLEAREVQVGQQSGEYLQVQQGLQVGEKVVTSGALFIDRAAKGGQA